MDPRKKDNLLSLRVAKAHWNRSVAHLSQRALAQAWLAHESLSDLTEKATALIEASKAREHIYKEAGDMVFLYQAALEDLGQQLAQLSYMVGHVEAEAVENDIPQGVRQHIQKALKGDA